MAKRLARSRWLRASVNPRGDFSGWTPTLHTFHYLFCNNSRMFWITLETKLLLRRSHVYKKWHRFCYIFYTHSVQKCWQHTWNKKRRWLFLMAALCSSVIITWGVVVGSNTAHSFNNGCRRLWIILVSGSINCRTRRTEPRHALLTSISVHKETLWCSSTSIGLF